jgi:hypothetical protein
VKRVGCQTTWTRILPADTRDVKKKARKVSSLRKLELRRRRRATMFGSAWTPTRGVFRETRLVIDHVVRLTQLRIARNLTT